jgi:Ca2+-binding EF-hand superfamily protein
MARARSPVLLAPLLALAASAACSQPAPPDTHQGMTLDRYLDRQTSRIMAADIDGDGRISRAEMSGMDMKGGRDPTRFFDRMDANHDGYLDKAEIQAALTQRFRRMDRDGNGVVTPDERMALQMRRARNGAAADAAAPQP